MLNMIKKKEMLLAYTKENAELICHTDLQPPVKYSSVRWAKFAARRAQTLKAIPAILNNKCLLNTSNRVPGKPFQ